MSSSEQHAAGPSQRSVEIGVAITTAIFAAIVIYGSLHAGIGWGAEGPMAGFFPFYVGIVIAIASVANLANIWPMSPRPRFAEWGQLRQVAFVLVPTIVYVALIPQIGIYVSSVLLIAFFMRWLGRYGAGMIAAVAIGVPVATFFVFERWFLVPLPKGPLEAALGY